jgi:ABC-type nitrate/sulfonate/bicarbonate transport system permease component
LSAPAPERRRGTGGFDAIRSSVWLSATVGVVGLLVVWTVLALTVFRSSGGVPTPLAVARQLTSDGWAFYWPNLRQTGSEAIRGFVAGNLLAFACALLVLLIPPVERVVMQIAVVSYCIPLMAIGPILSIVLSDDMPMVVLSALAVFFTTLVGVLLGLRAADTTTLDLVRAYGGGRWMQLWKVRLIGALPSTLAALKMAAPAAVLGAIIGEYLGHVDNGLGVAMTTSQQQLDIARTWGIAIVAGAVAGLAYAAIGLLARFATPWARGSTTEGGQ